MDVPVVPGAVLVNVGDLMQRWTADRLVSSVSVATATTARVGPGGGACCLRVGLVACGQGLLTEGGACLYVGGAY